MAKAEKIIRENLILGITNTFKVLLKRIVLEDLIELSKDLKAGRGIRLDSLTDHEVNRNVRDKR